MIALLIFSFISIAFMQVPGLIKKQWWKEVIVYLFLWLLGLILSLLIALGVKIQITSIIWNFTGKLLGLK